MEEKPAKQGRQAKTREEKPAKQGRQAKTREEKPIASQAAEIAAPKAQAKASKALGVLARGTQRAPQAAGKPERSEATFRLRTNDPAFNVSAACEAPGASRRGHCGWMAAAPARACRDRPGELGISRSMSRKACCWDNAPIGSFWGRMKEQIGDAGQMPHGEIVALVDDCIDCCSNERGQARPGWLTPMEYAAKLVA